jgi:hypothetical protein
MTPFFDPSFALFLILKIIPRSQNIPPRIIDMRRRPSSSCLSRLVRLDEAKEAVGRRSQDLIRSEKRSGECRRERKDLEMNL